MPGINVYSFGMVSSSTLLVLKNAFPEADAYAEFTDKYYMTGGEAANSSIVLSKLGLKVRLDGNWLGNNDCGNRTIRFLKSYGIDTNRLTRKVGYQNVEEFVVTDGLTRTNFGTYIKLLFTDKQWNDPNPSDIKAAQIVCLDPFFHEASRKAAELCASFSKSYVTVDCKYDNPVSMNAACVILSGEFRKNEYKGIPAQELFELYRSTSKGLVVFTSGASEILFGRAKAQAHSHIPPTIKAVDSTGGGDSFRSGIIYGMLQGWDDKECINFAAHLAAYICTTFPGVLKAPVLNELNEFMGKQAQ